MKTLLQKAMETKVQRKERKFTDEDFELALAYVTGNVNLTQVSSALGYKKGDSSSSSQSYNFVAMCLRYYIKNNLRKVDIK